MKCLGLWTGPNPQDAPPGSLRLASNISLRRPHLIVPRLGFNEASGYAARSTSYRPYRLFQNGEDVAIISYLSSGPSWRIERYTTTTVYESANNNATPPESTGWPTQAVYVNESLFYTSSNGIRKLDTASVSASAVVGQIMTDLPVLETAASASIGWVASGTDGSFAYRLLWTREDSDGYLIRGVPSARVLIADDGTDPNAWYPILRPVRIPPGIAAGDWLEVYRSRMAVGLSSTSPSAELYRAIRYEVTSTDISNGYTPSMNDLTEDNDLGQALYSNPGQEGALRTKYPPPRARVMAHYGDATWYGNAEQLETAVLEVATVGGSLTAAGTNPTALQRRAVTGDFSSGSPTISNVSDFTDMAVGQWVSDLLDAPGTAGTYVPADTTISAFDSGAGTITMSANALATNTTQAFAYGDTLTIDGTLFFFTDAADTQGNTYAYSTETSPSYQRCIDLTRTAESGPSSAPSSSTVNRVAQRIAQAVNSYALWDSSWTIWAVSADPDFSEDGGGSLVLFRDDAGGASYAISSSRDTAFSHLPASSDDNYVPGRVWYSQPGEPEAVPLVNFIDVGQRQKHILQLTALRDALLVWKEDGLFRITGAGGVWTVDPIDVDPSAPLRLLHPDAVAVYGGMAYAFTDRGFVVATDTGAHVISPAISEELREYILAYTTIVNRGAGTYALAMPSLDSVAFAVATNPSADVATQWYVWHVGNQSWSVWARDDRHAIYAGIVSAAYTAPNLDGWALQQSRGWSDTQAVDVQLASLACSVSSTTVTIAQTEFGFYTPAVGDVLNIGASYAVVTAVVDASPDWTITTDTALTVDTSCDWYQSFAVEWEYNPPPPAEWQRFWQIAHLHIQGASTLGNIDHTLAAKWTADDGTQTTQSVTLDDTVTRSKAVRMGLPLEVCRAGHLYGDFYLKAAGADFAVEGLTLEFEPVTLRTER